MNNIPTPVEVLLGGGSLGSPSASLKIVARTNKLLVTKKWLLLAITTLFILLRNEAIKTTVKKFIDIVTGGGHEL